MSANFNKVKDFLSDLGLPIDEEDEAEELVVVSDEDRGIHQLIIDCEDPILILEQIVIGAEEGRDLYKRLLEMNRDLIHGAFALDVESGTVLFRDTLRLDTLDRAELEGSINALGLALAENADELLSYADSA